MRRKKGCSFINLENGVDAWSRKTRAHASLFGCEAGGPETPNHWRGHGAESHAGSALSRGGAALCAEGPTSPEAHQKRTDAQSVLLIFLIYPTCLIYPVFQSIRLAQVSGLPRYSPTSPSGFSWSSSWIAASSGFWHVPARYGRSAAGPWNRTGSNNSCC